MNNQMEKMNQSQKILLAAFECISTKGYANVSLRDIADEAGVVLSQLNYYYKNKEGLLTEVIKMMMQKYMQEVEECLQNRTTAEERIASLNTYFRNMLMENPRLFRLLYDVSGMALWSATFGELLRNLFSDLANLIEKHVIDHLPDKSKLRGHSAKSIARMIFGAMFGIAIQVILDPQEKRLPEALNAIELVFE